MTAPRVLALAGLLTSAALAQPLADLPGDTVVARAGGRDILARDLLGETIQRYGYTALADLVAEAQLEAGCREAGIGVEPAEIDEILHARREGVEGEAWERYLAASGGEALLRRGIRRDLLFERWLGDRVEPSEDELTEVYRLAPLTLEQASGRGILVTSEAEAKDLRAGVLTAANFADIARDVSLDETSARGGDLGVVSLVHPGLPPSAAAQLLAATEGSLVGPLESDEGWWLLLRGATLESRLATFEEQRPQLAEQVRASKLAAARARWRRLVRAGQPPAQLSLGGLYELSGGRGELLRDSVPKLPPKDEAPDETEDGDA